MPHLYVQFLIGALLGMPAQRVLLLEDRAQASFEQTVVHQSMVQELLNDPQVDLLVPGSLTQGTVRAAEMRRIGCGELAQARRDYQRRRLADARAVANRATQKLWRVAQMTGEMVPWLQARTLQAAVLGALGHERTAVALLTEVFAVDPTYEDPTLSSPTLRRHIRRAQEAVATRTQVQIGLDAGAPDAGLWLDGRFVGFAKASVKVPRGTSHVALATRPGHTSRTQTVLATRRTHLQLDPVAEAPAHNAMYAELVASTRQPTAFPDPNSALFAALDPTSIWVLRYAQGGVHLAAFDLQTGRRHDQSTPAAIFDLADARRVARQLLVQPPSLPALERPPTS